MTQISSPYVSDSVVHPVELLRDRKGAYGIGLAKETDHRDYSTKMILRRDRLDG